MSELPQRPARLTDEQQAEITRLAIQQVPQAEIARRVGVQRKTVRRVIARQRAALTINSDLEKERAGAIEVYRLIQRVGWESIKEHGRAPSPLLAEINRAQQRIDTLMGTAPAGPDDPALALAQFKAAVVQVIQAESPGLAPKIAQRLLLLADGRPAAPDMSRLSNDELRAIIAAGERADGAR